MLRLALLCVCFAFSGSVQYTALGQQGVGIDPRTAEASFQEAKALSDADAGVLWGKTLYGPILFVESSNHQVVANEGDPGRILHQQGNVYEGILPKDMILANTAVEWEGKRWTMILWPLPEHKVPRDRLLMHELFHRIQPSLGLKLADPENAQLDSMEGRLWLQLEWRALAAAEVQSGDAQRLAISDALAFREERFRLFSHAAEAERELEMNEGLAEYTGVRVGSPDLASAKWRTVQQLVSPEASTFVRSFAYTSGPAYALLLDHFAPQWRTGLRAEDDLAHLLEHFSKVRPSPEPAKRALIYGSSALSIGEREREALAAAAKAHYTQLLIDGPTLTLPNAGKFNFGFNPNELVPLGAAGTVYPSMQASDDWGTLKVEGGALLASDYNKVTVAAPWTTQADLLKGNGWTLTLKRGWYVSPVTDKAGSYKIVP